MIANDVGRVETSLVLLMLIALTCFRPTSTYHKTERREIMKHSRNVY